MKTGKKFIQNIQTELLDLKSKNVESSKLSSLTHYIHNNKNGVSEFYKNDAVNYLEKILTNSFSKKTKVTPYGSPSTSVFPTK